MWGFILPNTANSTAQTEPQVSYTTLPNWKWDTSVNVREKKCAGCKKSMYTDIHHAVQYKDETWHLHCLLDMLTEHHSGKKVVQPEELSLNWGNAP